MRSNYLKFVDKYQISINPLTIRNDPLTALLELPTDFEAFMNSINRELQSKDEEIKSKDEEIKEKDVEIKELQDEVEKLKAVVAMYYCDERAAGWNRTMDVSDDSDDSDDDIYKKNIPY